LGSVTNAQRLGSAVTTLVSLARDLEVATLAYAQTGRDTLVGRIDRVRASIATETTRLHDVVPTYPDGRVRADSFLAELDSVLATSERAVSARRVSGADAAWAVLASTDGLQARSALATTGDQLVAAALQRVASDRAATAQDRRITGDLILGSFVFALVMLGYASWRLRSEWRRRAEAERALRAVCAETERKVDARAQQLMAAKAELEAREDRLRLVADFGIVHLLTTRSDWSADCLSDGFCQITGMDQHAVLGKGWIDAIHPDDRAPLFDAWAAASLKTAPIEADFRLRTADGSYRGFKLRGVPAVSGTGEVSEWFCAMIDLHDEQAAEARRAESLQFEQAARASAELANRVKDDLLATVSHELRTPLNAIVGWTQILKIDRGENRARAIEAIERSAFVQTRLIDDLLAVSKMSNGQLVLNVTPIDLRATVRGALLAVGPAASAKGVTIEVNAPEVVPLRGDEARLQQVAWNLLSNAIKFTPTSGRVTVEVSRIDDGARLCVKDTGEGIESGFLPYVFEPFRQGASRSSRTGLGLGLAIVQQIVALHGGTVVATSDGARRGSSFTILLPGHHEIVPAVAPIPLLSDLQTLNLRVLVVEDDEDAAVTLSTLLTHRGCRVEVAHTVEECLRMFDGSIPDVLLCDIGLPDGDGYSLLRELRRHTPGRHVAAIALSAYARDEDRALAADAGFSAYVTKPYEVEQLLSYMRHAAHAH
jgi:PAS domain S-box-containing protein